MKELLKILTYKRPAGSKTELAMISELIDVLPDVVIDGFGNRIVRVGSDNTTMFSCHTDTVHDADGMQLVSYDEHKSEAFVTDSSCLGADDGAGIYIMIQMIRAKVNGLYVFHREEEIGGNGSYYIASSTPQLLDGIKRCLAFDRRGTYSVITHQGGLRCCSDAFGDELVNALMFTDMIWMTDDTGSFTDSANYVDIIPECTNVSCGYAKEHSKLETLNVKFVLDLVKLLLVTDFDGLVTQRDPTVITESDYWDQEYYIAHKAPDFESLNTAEEVEEFVYEYPEEAADLLMEYKRELEIYYMLGDTNYG